MTVLFTLTFQGTLSADGAMNAAEEREAARLAFPMSPPRDAALRDGYAAFKMAPLTSGRTMLSAVSNRGDVDGYQRPVLRAVGCLLDASRLVGAERDPTAVWEALRSCDPQAGAEAFEERVVELSIHTSPAAFEGFRSALQRSGPFYAKAVAVLGGEAADFYLGRRLSPFDALRPILGLLSISRLRSLHLAIGGESAELREPYLVLSTTAPEASRRSGGLLSGLLRRQKEDEPPTAVDFEDGEVFGSRAAGPRALAEAIADDRPWPGEASVVERYAALLECLDSGRSPFEVVAELEEMRQAVERLESLAKELAKLS